MWSALETDQRLIKNNVNTLQADSETPPDVARPDLRSGFFLHCSRVSPLQHRLLAFTTTHTIIKIYNSAIIHSDLNCSSSHTTGVGSDWWHPHIHPTWQPLHQSPTSFARLCLNHRKKRTYLNKHNRPALKTHQHCTTNNSTANNKEGVDSVRN